MGPTQQEEPRRQGTSTLPTETEVLPRRVWRSGLFWRMLGGALIAFAALLITAGLSLRVINGLVAESDRMQGTLASAGRIQRFAASLDSTYNALNALLRPNY